jgi:FlaA1/EpsC-like NDP-sugar epimerase
LCVLAVWLAICFRFESWVSFSGYQWLAVALSISLAIPLLTAFGFYHTVVRFVGRQTITAALRAIGIYAIIYSTIFTAIGFPLVPRAIGVLQPILLLFGLAVVRLIASQLLAEQTIKTMLNDQLPGILIYGAGNAGQQLASSLKSKNDSRVVAFLDDNASLHNARIGGIPVRSPSDINQLVSTQNIRDVLLAIPRLNRSRRNEIIKHLRSVHVAVRTLPSLTDLANGKVSENDLRELDIEDLLGRDPVKPIAELMKKNTAGKVVLVTGAGGSIGSELCRQILLLAPKQLIMLDVSEFALYSINEELVNSARGKGIQLTPVLCNVMEEKRLHKLFAELKPHTVYHAAAYKHVPLVEANPIAGLRNNVLGTLAVAQASLNAHAENMVLISTDKAVRPTNVMGASKRLAEMVIQALAAQQSEKSKATQFTLVRFGNVLGSSGSVIPKFREQILKGEPITLTHPEITRFFMSISEASQLVIQAAALSEDHRTGAKVYHLDMGESIKIIDLAKLMIQLSGLTHKDEQHPQGDVEIKVLGLRPAEKLYEELLVDNISTPTLHPKIVSAVEAFAPMDDILELISQLDQLNVTAEPSENLLSIRTQLKKLVDLRES